MPAWLPLRMASETAKATAPMPSFMLLSDSMMVRSRGATPRSRKRATTLTGSVAATMAANRKATAYGCPIRCTP